MSKKLDDLFSPERLRKEWFRKKQTGAAPDLQAEGRSPFFMFDQLRCLVEGRFRGDDLAVLNLLLDELQKALDAVFLEENDKDADVVPSRDDSAVLAKNILNQLEDLLEAFEARHRSRKRQ